MKTVTVKIRYRVRESNRADGCCTCGGDPLSVESYSTYPSTELYRTDGEGRTKAAFDYGSDGVDTDNIWNNDTAVEDRKGNPVFVCTNEHYFVNPNIQLG